MESVICGAVVGGERVLTFYRNCFYMGQFSVRAERSMKARAVRATCGKRGTLINPV